VKLSLILIFSILLNFKVFSQTQDNLKARFYDGRFLVYASNYKIAEEVGYKIREIYNKTIKKLGYVDAYKTQYQIFIWQNKDELLKFLEKIKLKNPEQISAVALYDYKEIPTIACYYNERLIEELQHEFTHLLIVQILDVSPKEIPLWLNEGLAMYISKDSVINTNNFLKNSPSFIELSKLLDLDDYPKDKKERDLFYLESHSLVNFLIDKAKNREVFMSFLRWYVKKGYPFKKAYLYSYNIEINLEKFQEEWRSYIKKGDGYGD